MIGIFLAVIVIPIVLIIYEDEIKKWGRELKARWKK